MEQPQQYNTTDTPLAAYLIQAGFALLEIQYEIKSNGKRQATFVFGNSIDFQEKINQYNRGEATINLVLYEHTRSNLLDRIMRGVQ